MCPTFYRTIIVSVSTEVFLLYVELGWAPLLSWWCSSGLVKFLGLGHLAVAVWPFSHLFLLAIWSFRHLAV